jgi:osmotically-inducible protein OsmY
VSRFLLALRLALVLGLSGSLCGCPLAIVGGLGAAGGAGYAANQERGVGGLASDFSIKTNLQAELAKADPKTAAHIDVTVYEGHVLLTGTTPDPQVKAAAEGAARSIPGVREVFNQIEVGPPVSAWHATQDAWITSRIRSGLIFSDVRSVNYTIKTVDHSVYLIGSARSQEELNHATDLARNVQGVKRVVSYIEVRPGAPPATASAGAPPMAAAGPSGAEVPAAAPTTPVEARKL